MSPIAIASIVFACVFSGALVGMFLRSVLPDDHLSQDSKDVVKLGMGLIATMAALVLGLLIASAKSSFDTETTELKQMAAKIVVLDRALAHYGPETKDVRDLLRSVIAFRLALTWPEEVAVSAPARLDAPDAASEGIETKIRELAPQNDMQRGLQARALQIIGDVLQARWLVIGGAGNSMPMPFLVVLVCWISVLFASFGLFAPRNATVVGVLLVCALSVAASIYLIVELDRPFDGLMKISSAPLRYTLARLGK